MDDLDATEFILGLIGLGIILGFFVAYILFLLAQQNTLRAIKPHNQKMPPGHVWLQLIPVFNLVWQFVVVNRIADSIRAEIDDRISTSFLGDPEPVFLKDKIPRPTYGIGLAACILSLGSFMFFFEPLEAFGSYVSLAFLVCWIVYWTQIAMYKNRFLKHPW